jgi:hypothetical protein
MKSKSKGATATPDSAGSLALHPSTPTPEKGQPDAERPEVEVAGLARKEDRMHASMHAEDLSRHTPAWAIGATATEAEPLWAMRGDGSGDVWDITRDGRHLGCVYDAGAGYVWAEGISSSELDRPEAD